MKSMFSQISNSSVLNLAKRLAMAVVFLSFATIARAGWSGTATMNVGVTSTNTGGGTVYVSTTKTATSGEQSANTGVSDSSPSANFFLFATPISEDYSFAGWFKDEAGTISATLSGTTTPTGKGDQHTLTGSSNARNPKETFYAKFKHVSEYNIVFKATSGGTYTATHTTDVKHSHTISSTDWTADDINKKTALDFALKATPATGYQFLRWIIKDTDNGTTVYNYTNPSGGFLHTFTSSAELYAEFIPQGAAMFCLLGNETVLYLKLSEAIKAAAEGSNKVVVLHRSGKLYHEIESTTYYDAAANKYTIPAGVTLLIPNSDNMADYVVHMDALTENQIGSGFSEKKKLTIGDGQDIDVYGDMCIYAKVAANSGAVGPYGRVHLEENSDITLKSGAHLNTLGYITGHKNSSVIAENGATVREVLQVGDWRGGTAMSAIAKSANDHRVFPISQYYVQNIETKLELQYGAIEYLTAFMTISTFKIPASAILISPKEGDYTGMFRTGTGTKITKYYDEATDRLKFGVTAEGESNVIFDQVALELAKGDNGLQIALNMYLGTSTITSADYVLPINNNMDIHIMSGITVDVQHDVALLAGATLEVDKGAKIQTSNGASIYVYDAEQHHVKFTEEDKNYSKPLYKDYYYNYFGASHEAIKPISKRPGTLYNRTANDMVTWTNPEKAGNTTSLQKNDATVILNGEFSGAIYTTEGKASIISTDESANAKVTFTGLSAQTIKQCVQTVDGDNEKVHYPDVPCLPSAALKNADGTYSAGSDVENGKIYTYYPLWDNGDDQPTGRWSDVLPKGEITPASLEGNNVTVTIPDVKTSDITFEPQADDTEIIGVDDTKTIFSGTRFASNGAVTFTNGVVTIPIKYTPTTTHDDNITDAAPETVTISFNCHNIVSDKDEVVTLTIKLTATQNYQPEFLVNESVENVTLDFGDVYVYATSNEKIMQINPVADNVTDRSNNNGQGYVTWTPTELSVNSPFEIVSGDYFSGVKVVYKPQTTAGTNAEGYHTQTLTVKATYSAGVELEKTIVLKGKPMIASNPLQFVEDREIYPNDVIDPLFISTGNGEGITYTYNGLDASDIVEIVESGDNYKLQVKPDANIITKQEIIIRASQTENDATFSGSDEIKVTITPTVQWNWSKLYFGTEYDNAADVIGDTNYEVTYKGDCATIPAANFHKGTDADPDKRYTVTVGSGEECTATFVVKHEGVSYTFSSEVYADPRVLDMCVSGINAARTYRDITKESTNVRYEDGILFATTEESGALWTMEIVGVPDKMEFIPSGEGKKWTISEYDGENWTTTYQDAEIVLAEGQTHFVHNLNASTQQIRIACSLGVEQGKITDLCIYALNASVSADAEKLYMPIAKDENGTITQSQRNVVLSYVSPLSELWLSVVDGAGNTISDITLAGDNLSNGKLPKTTATNLYRAETIVVSSTHPTAGTMYLLVKDRSNSEKLKLPIRLYNYPQPLPMRSAEWKDENAEKYYFYTDFDRSQYVQYVPQTQNISFSSTDGNLQFITFVFQGGPSYIEFETQTEMTPTEWYDYWTLQVTDGISNRLVAEDENAEVQPEITTTMRGDVTYYKVHVDVPYTTKALTLHTRRPTSIENVVIDGTPDLDVVQGNHTIEHEGEVNFTPDVLEQDVVVTAINLEQLKVSCNNPHFSVTHNTSNITSTPTTLTATDCPKALGSYIVGNITLHVTWDGVNTVDEGLLSFTDKNNQELATIRLLGAKDYILKGNSENTGLFTGFATNITAHPFTAEKKKYQYARRQVNLSNTFDKNGVALFDYLIVYGETTAEDLGSTILSANTTRGSNAHTPMYVYRKVANDEGVYDRYQFIFDQANVNQDQKPLLHTVVDAEGQQLIPHAKETEGTQYIDIAEGEQLRVYMTGFCPYASTGFDKTQEGVWLFRAKKNAKLDIYLEDCHIYSRNKTRDGHAFTGKTDPGADIFQELYARGSGAALVFENNDNEEYDAEKAFQVTVHTRGNNLLKSSHGCFYEFLGVRAYQVSSPIQIRMTSDQFYVQNSKTHLTFDDKWPNDVTNYKLADRTNGFLSLQKLNNNAPSIDMGNGNTVVNFRGGQVELQNAQNVSDKYKTTLAISYRSGIMATGGVEIQMAHGLGTDAATLGTVNFYDGTISVIKMYVDPEDRKYYLMDPQIQNGDTIKDANGNVVLSDSTSCLRCPQHTYVYGGSICMLRTCMSPTSQGGAPTDGVSPLGRFFYTEDHGYEYNTADKQEPANRDDASQWLVNPVRFPSDITLFEGLADYHTNTGKYTYGIESVTPNKDGQLVFWIPDGFGGVKAEQDRYITAWKACMPEITAILTQVGTTVVGGTVGGPTGVANIEDVDNLLYCDMDEHIYDIISATTGEGEDMRYIYEAPLKVPEGFQMDGIDLGIGDYLRLAPSNVGSIDEHEMTNEEDYNINNKVYYVSSATADIWQTFTAPFDVERIWVVETFDENALAQIQPSTEERENGITKRQKILTVQANHNADFAAFFGVAMALGSEKSFDEIFDEYMGWAANIEDKHEGTLDTYTKRGRIELQAYDGTNWADAHFYMYHNTGNWTINDADNGVFDTKWEYVKKEGNVLLKKGETYSMLFPYCTGCWDEGGEATREYWDYWSGKLIIFESTQASKDHPHVLRGSNYVAATRPAKGDWVFANDEVLNEYPEVVVTGNSSLAHMTTNRTDVFIYTPSVNKEAFYPLSEDDDEQVIFPSTAFLYGYVPTNAQGMPARGVKRTGEIIYGKDNTATDVNPGGNIPTVGGGNDLFITSTATGINIAVAEPQQVRVMSATGATLFSGMVQTAVDVFLPTAGVYVVAGDNEVHKILH